LCRQLSDALMFFTHEHKLRCECESPKLNFIVARKSFFRGESRAMT
jgi:hypothetical protein